MPWCAYWGAPIAGFWWVMPLIGLLLMGLMFFFCSRCMSRMARGRRSVPAASDLQRELESLRDEVRKLRRTS